MGAEFSESVRASIAGGVWIYLSGLAASLLGFVFWIAMTRLVGVGSVGLASSVVSSSSIASSIVSAGLNLAIVREVAIRGRRALAPSMALTLVLGIASSMVAVPMVLNLGLADPRIVASSSLLAFLTVFSIYALASLIGLEKFRQYFIAVLGGSISKVVVGVALALIGVGFLAPLIGYLTYSLTLLSIALLLLGPNLRHLGEVRLRDLTSLAALAFSNYPFVFSNQLMTMLSIYLFAYIVRKSLSTGIFYVSIMVALSIASIPGSILGAALPIGTRRKADPFAEGLRIGLSIAMPLTVPLIAYPQPLLSAINVRLLEGVDALRILLVSIPPLASLSALINRLNKDKRVAEIAAVGIARLALLTSTIAIFSRLWGLEGAALAFFVSNAALLPYVFVRMPSMVSPFTKLWIMVAATAAATRFLPGHELLIAVVATATSLLLMHFGKVFTVREAISTFRIVLNELRGARGSL